MLITRHLKLAAPTDQVAPEGITLSPCLTLATKVADSLAIPWVGRLSGSLRAARLRGRNR